MLGHALRPMTASDVEQVLKWRNDREVRKYMFSNHEIKLEEHLAWYASASKSSDISLLIYEQDGIAQGFVNITLNRSALVADWGFYLAPDARRGSGKQLGQLALKFAFTKLRAHKICGQAIGFNKPSISFHKKLGFIEEGVLREQHFDGCKYHDVLCFGLLSKEWPAAAKD